MASMAIAGLKPLASVSKYDGKFTWVKLGFASAETVKTLVHAKAIVFDVTFSHDVKLKKAANGSQWFTFIVADQGSDWKWNQAKASAIVPTSGGTIKAGKYTLSIPTAGISAKALADKQQSISLGPSSSGLQAPASFTIERLKGQ